MTAATASAPTALDRPLDAVRVHLSGSIRGRTAADLGAFHTTAARLRAAGADVFSPVEDLLRRGLTPGRPGVSPEVIGEELNRVAEADVVALLPGWRESGEAAVVRSLADLAGVRVVEVEDLLLAAAAR